MEIVNPKIKKKKAKVISFRIYATKRYCYNTNNPSTAKNIKDLNPLFIDNFPEKGCKLNCYFGKVPEHIIKLKYSIDGLGLKIKKELRNRYSKSKQNAVSLEDCISEVESTSNDFQGYCWFNTIVIEKAINPYNYGMISENGEFCSYEAHRYFRESYKELNYSEIFDKISLCLLTEIEPAFFDELLFSEVALIIDDTNIIAVPKNLDPAEGYQFCENELINKDKIISLIEKMNLSSNNWLNTIAHSRTAMLIEKDPWKKYLLGFVCLEVITHKAFKRISAKNSFEVKMRAGNLLDDKVSMPFLDFIPKDDNCRKLPPTMKFSLVAGVLNPENSSEDISAFKKCKEIRDEMSHGVIHSNGELPFEKLENLLEFYSHEILKLI